MVAEQCPVCHAWIPVDNLYVTWCEHCGWNLQPLEPARPRTVFESLYASMGKRFSRRLYNEVVRAHSLAPAMTLSKLLAFVFAGVVHGVTLLFAIGGLVLLFKGWPNPFAIIGGLLGLAAAFAVRPRVPKVPGNVAPRDRLPTLYQAVDHVAQALGVSTVDAIVIDWRFNASFRQVGWRRRKVLTLGLPLITILNGEERVALIAHELAHAVNGDPNRSFFTGTAVTSLIEWYRLLRPNRIWNFRSHGSSAGALADMGAVVGNLLSLCLSGVAWLGAYVLSHLLWHDSQRAEYLADSLAARVAGTDTMLAMLDKLHFSSTFANVVRSISVGHGSLSLFDELRRNVAEMPERELERIRRVEHLEATRLDVTHPPTAYRIELLKAHRIPQPQVVLSPLDVEQIDRELEPYRKPVQEWLVEMHRASLYY